MKRMLMTGLLMGALTFNALGAEKTSTGFYYPTKTDQLGSYVGFLDNRCSPNGTALGNHIEYHPTDVSENVHLYHTGKDIAQGYGLPVYAIADGEVLANPIAGWAVKIGEEAYALPIKHRLIDGSEFVAIYGHIISNLKKGDRVVAGQQIGTIAISIASHVHFGIALTSGLPNGKWGREDCSAWPGDITKTFNNFTDPIEFIQTHTPRNVKSHPAGTLVQAYGENEVYFLQNVGGNLVKRHIANPQTMTDNGFLFSEVLSISSEEKSCYPKGADIAGFERGTQFANGMHEGQLIYLQTPSSSGTPVFIVSGEKIHHVALTADEFAFAGWSFSNVQVNSGPWALGDDITLQDLTKCPNVPPTAALTPVTTLSRAPLPKGHYDLDPWIISYRRKDGLPSFLIASPYDIAGFGLGGNVLWQNGDAFGDMEIDSKGIIYALGSEPELFSFMYFGEMVSWPTGFSFQDLMRIDADTGQTLSRKKLNVQVFGNQAILTMNEGRLYAKSATGLYTLDKDTAKETLLYQLPMTPGFTYVNQSFAGKPVFGKNGEVIMTSRESYQTASIMRVIDPVSKTEQCHTDNVGYALSEPVVAEDGDIYTSWSDGINSGGHAYAVRLKAQDCSVVWKQEFWAGMVLKGVFQNTLYFKFYGGIIAVDRNNTSWYWITWLGDANANPSLNNWQEMTIDSDGSLYVLAGGMFIALDGSGKITNQFSVGTGFSNLALGPHGIGFVAGSSSDAWLQVARAKNIPPVLKYTAPQSLQSGEQGEINLVASYDLNGDQLVYRVWQNSADSIRVALQGSQEDVGSPIVSFTAPDVHVPTILTFHLYVMDKGFGDTDWKTIQVTVNPPPPPPATKLIGFVSNNNGNTVQMRDLDAHAVLCDITVGRYPSLMSYDHVTRLGFSASAGDNYVSVIDPAQCKEVSRIPSGGTYPVALAIDLKQRRLIVLNMLSASLGVIDLDTRALIGVYQAGERPVSLTFTPDYAHLLVSNAMSSDVWVYDAQTMTVQNVIPVESYPSNLAMDSSTGACYLTNEYTTLTLIDSGFNAKSIRQGNMIGMAISAASGTLYVADETQRAIIIISLESGTSTGSIPLPSPAYGLTLHPTKPLLYATLFGANTVVTINLLTRVIEEETPTDGPYPIGITIYQIPW